MKYIKLWIAAICILALALCQFSAIAEGQISNEPAPVDLQPAAEPNEAPAAPEHSEPEHSEPEHSEPEYSEPEYSEPEYSEPEYSEPEYSEPEYSEPEYSEPEYSEPESPESDGDSFIESQDTQDVVPYEAADETIAAAAAESEEYDPQAYISVTGNYRAGEETQFFYSDSMLLKDARTLSTDLAKASVVLACAAYETGYIDSIFETMKYTPTYYQYGTPKRTIENNDLVAFTIGTKTITNPDGEKFIVYCVPIKGTSGDEEWFSNFNIGKDNGGDHEGFYKASQNVISALAAKCNSDGFDPDHRIYWLTGHSRGAAVANIVAGKLTAAGSQHAGRIFAYTFACPAVSKNADTSMQNIYNFNNAGDVVTAVPLKQWHYERFGQTIEYAMKGDTEFEARFKSLTGEAFASPTDTSSYTTILVKLVPTEESLQEPKRKFALMTLAWAMSRKNGSTTWDKFASYYLKDTIDQKLMELVCGSGNPTTCISALDDEQTDYQQTKSFIERALDDTEGMTVDEFAQYQQDHYEEFKMAKKLTGIVVEQISDLVLVLSKISDFVPVAKDIRTLLACAKDLYTTSGSANPLTWIDHGHSCATYVLWINQRYYGYKGYYNSSRSSVDIGDNITTIGKSCFEGCSSLTGELKLPEGLTAIGEYAFSGCSGLESLYIPKSVNTLSDRCFYNCSGFKIVTLPIELSDAKSFSGCSNVETIHYTKGTTGIMPDRTWSELYYTLEYNSHTTLKSVGFEEGIVSIGDFAFYKHNEGHNGTGVLTEVVFPSTLESIGDYAFAGQTKLAIDLILPNGLINIGRLAFYGCISLKSLYIPKSVKELNDRCFSDCSGLKTVTLPIELSDAKSLAFYGCSNIETIHYTKGSTGIMADNLMLIDYDDTLEYFVYSSLKSVSFEEGIVSIRSHAFSCGKGTAALTEVILPSTLESIGASAFSGQANLAIDLILPENIVSLGDYTFSGCKSLKSLQLPPRLTSIGNSCFERCSSLTKLDLPDSLTSIANSAFSGCSNLTELKLPDTLTSIGNSAFSDCSNLTELKLPDGLTSIGWQAFKGCSGLTGELKLPDGLTYIGGYAFSGCSGLTGELKFPVGLTSIESYTFSGCSSLTGELKFPVGLTSIGYSAFGGCSGLTGELKFPVGLTSIEGYAFNGCSDLTGELKFPVGLTSIGYSAFGGCSGLTGELKFPVGLTSIGKYAFSGCTGIEKVDAGSATIDSHAFENCTGIRELIVPIDETSYGEFFGCNSVEKIHYTVGKTGIMPSRSSSSIDNYVEQCSGNTLREVAFDDGITRIGYGAFNGCSNLTGELKLPDGLTSIGSYAFNGCSGLTGELRMPETLVTIYDCTFSGCSGIEKVDVGSATIGYHAFKDCTGIKELIVPIDETSNCEFSGCNSVEKIHYTVGKTGIMPDRKSSSTTDYVEWCSKSTLQEVTFDEGITCIGYSAFGSSSASITGALRIVTLPNTLESIGDYAFRGHKNLNMDLSLPNGITSIGNYAFSGCSGLIGELKLPDGLTVIGNYAFSGCSGLIGELNLSNALTSIGTYTFSSCSGLTGELNLPDGLTNIGSYAFRNCSGLTGELKLPAGLTSIGSYAFSGCSGLTGELHIPENLVDIKGYTFFGCTGIEKVDAGLATIGYHAFKGCTGIKELIVPIDETSNCEFYGCNSVEKIHYTVGKTGIMPNRSSSGINDYVERCSRNTLQEVTFDKDITKIQNSAFSGCSSDLILYGWSGSCAHVYAVKGGLRFIALDADLFADAPGNQCAIAWNFKNSGDVSWSSANEAVAKVSDGVVTATSVGTTTVHAAFADGRSRDIAITVREGSVLQLPAALQMIDEEAFCGNTAIERIIIPDGVTQIGKLAFADCANIAYIRIPDSVETIADNAFQNCKRLIILCGSGSYAAHYADAHGIARDSI